MRLEPSDPGLDSAEWHRRFIQQAAWTRQLRAYLFERVSLARARRVLDVGCGTGALLEELPQHASAETVGIDLDFHHLRFAKHRLPAVHALAGDALSLPFQTASFDVSLCHFVLLWVREPQVALREFRRVTRPGGAVIALAEPDYGGRIDHPAELAELGGMQTAALAQQGADPLIGRKLTELFHAAGLVNVETGVLGGQWSSAPSVEAWESEWAMLEHDLGEWVPSEKLARLREIDRSAWQSGARTLFIPTFYAVGWVEENKVGR
jgi:ubiquinone/menaquinone biosynthesis C-methylase UbiE